jgi:hypothetical protein
MNFALQNIVAFFLVIATVIIGAYFLFFRQQGQYIPETWGELGCIHPIYIKGEDLQPKLQRGTFLFLNQCITGKGTFNNNDVVLIEEDGEKTYGIVEDRDGDMYTVNIGDSTVEIENTYITAYTTLPSEY